MQIDHLVQIQIISSSIYKEMYKIREQIFFEYHLAMQVT